MLLTVFSGLVFSTGLDNLLTGFSGLVFSKGLDLLLTGFSGSVFSTDLDNATKWFFNELVFSTGLDFATWNFQDWSFQRIGFRIGFLWIMKMLFRYWIPGFGFLKRDFRLFKESG